MAYVLNGAWARNPDAPFDRQAETALEALRAFVSYLREDHRPVVQDEMGEMVLPSRLLAEAREHGAGAQLVTVLADYAEAVRVREMDIALGRLGVLNSPEYEVELRLREAEGGSTTWRRGLDAEERDRLRDVVFGERSPWHLAGVAWASDFLGIPPDEVVAELDERHPHTHVHELRQGAEEQLSQPPRYHVAPTVEGLWGVWHTDEGELGRRWVHEGMARAHAATLNAGRPWTEQDYGREVHLAALLSLQRQQGRMRSVPRQAPAPPPTPRRAPGRQP